MFGYIDKVDKKLNQTHRNYFLTQGDTFTLSAGIEPENIEAIEKIVFKIGKRISECEIQQMYEQDYVLVDGEYLCKVSGDVTAEWQPTDCPDNAGEPYVYEVEAHYVDGEPETLEQAEFTVEVQIRR